LALLFLATACGKKAVGPEYRKEITVSGFLWGNQKIDSSHAILVATTRPIAQVYDLQEAGIRGAEVSITDASTGMRTVLHDTPGRPGFYFNDSLTVVPKTAYTLRIRVDEMEVTASTTVPPVLRLTTTLKRDTVNVVHQKDLSRNRPIFLDHESPDQIVLVDMFCNEPLENAEYIQPFHKSHSKPENQNEYDGGNNGPPRHIMGMARIKEMVSPSYPDNRPVIDWYSSMLVFFGSNTLTVMAIDSNYHKVLYAEHPELEGGIQGGIGRFGSMCGEKFEFRVIKEDEPVPY